MEERLNDQRRRCLVGQGERIERLKLEVAPQLGP
jgi:hypothetical protein